MLLSEDELLLKNTVRDFADRELAPRAAAYDESGEFPWDNVRGLAGLGLFGLTIDEDFGGTGGTTRQLAVAVEYENDDPSIVSAYKTSRIGKYWLEAPEP